MSAPNLAVPESGRVLPVMTSIMVVLPAPLGPMMQRSSPGSTCSVSSLSALKPSKLTVRLSRYSVYRARSFFDRLRLSSASERLRFSGFLARPDTRPTIPRGRNSVTSTNSAPSA